MLIERWFPINFELPNRFQLQGFACADDNWQLYKIGTDSRVLFVKPELVERWISAKLIDPASFSEIKFGDESYLFIESGNNQQLAPVNEFISPESKVDAIAFAGSMCLSRKIVEDAFFHDAIYVERLSRLLPTWTISERVSDETVLGSWLTGGVSVSISSFRRISTLLTWLSKSDVKDVIRSAGLQIPDDFSDACSKRSSDIDEDTNFPKKKLVEESSDSENNGRSGIRNHKFRLSGRPILESFFNDHVVHIIQNEDRYRVLGVNFPSPIILHGPPGCGKTFAVEKLIEFLDWPAFEIDTNSVGSPYIHETSRRTSKIFEKAMDDAPAVIVIDEMESFLSDRQNYQSSGLHHVEEVAVFLRRIPEAMSKKVLVIGMTNRLEMIDSAILRRGRFDHVIKVGMPSKDEVTDLVYSLLNKMPVEGELLLHKMILTLTGRPLSDASFTIREAARIAAKSGKDRLNQNSIDIAIAKLSLVEKEKQAQSIGFNR